MSKLMVSNEVSTKQNNIKTLLRFLWDLKLARQQFLAMLALTFLGSLIPILFMWLLAKSVECGAAQVCSADIAWSNFSINFSITVYLFLGLFFLALFAKFLSLAGFEIGGMWSTQLIHKRVINSLNSVRVTFFDENPTGKLINRIVADYSYIRVRGVGFIADAVYATSELVCISIIMLLANPVLALSIIPIAYIYIYFQAQVSPMFGHITELRSIHSGDLLHRETELIEGRDLHSIYDRESRLFERVRQSYEKILDLDLLNARLAAWGYFWMTLASVIFSMITYTYIIIALSSGTISQPLAGVVITVLFTLEGCVVWIATTMPNLSNASAIIRRLYQLIDLPPEYLQERLDIGLNRTALPQPTPKEGMISFENFSMSYREDSTPVIENLNLNIRLGEHTGIIGRTGSGKSSICQSLLRMVYVRAGDIKINGKSIYRQNFAPYRSQFGIAPQDPYLFSGTIRYNLIFCNEIDLDQKLNKLLEITGLHVSLDDMVDVEGNNLSAGQRQLIALLRALVSNRPIIILDEPTSHIDSVTDAKIQDIVNQEFKGRTVITIAHKESFLSGCNVIYELRDGKVTLK